MKRISEIVDKNNKKVTEGDTLVFIYEGVEYEAKITHKGGIFGVMLPNNDPFSCTLSDLKSKVASFEIKVMV